VLAVTLLCVSTFSQNAFAQTSAPHTPQELMKALIENERQAILTKERYEYLSNERSDRTGGHYWTERVVETAQGRVRLLTAIDNKPLAPQQEKQERDRLAAIAASPDEFIRHEMAQRGDEEHARHLLEQLPDNFLFDNVRLQDGVWRMDYRPNPDVSPSSIEDQVLHGMSGWISINERDMRLLHIEGKLSKDVEIGFGLLANIHAGSRFSSDRQLVDGHWRTAHVVTEIRGKAALFKNVSRNSDLTRSDFHYLDRNITVPEAIDRLLHDQTASVSH
jgi:hypothetical protein